MELRFMQSEFSSPLDRKIAAGSFVPLISRHKDPEVLSAAMEQALKAYRADPQNVNTVNNFVVLLQYLCRDRRSVHAKIPVTEVVQVLSNNLSNQDVVERSVSVLSAACTVEERRNVAIEQGGIELAAQILQNSAENLKLVEECLSMLANICIGSVEAKRRTFAALVPASMLNLLKSEDPGIVYCSVVALRNLTAMESEIGKPLQEAGAIPLLLNIITKFPQQKIRYQALLALQNVANGEQEAFETILQDETIVEKALDVLRRQPDVEGVQLKCLQFLTSVAETDESARQKIGKAGGIQTIVSTLRKMKSNKAVAMISLFALRFLLFEDLNREMLDRCQGMDAVTDCLKHYSPQVNLKAPEEIELIVENCMRVFSNATIDNTANKNAAAMNGAVQAVAELMKLYMNSEVVQEQGCRCLRNMADRCELNRRVQVESGAIDQILLSLLAYPELQGVQEHGIASLVNLANGENAIQKMKDTNVTDAVKRALQQHPDHVNIQSQGQALISRIDIFNEPEFEESTAESKSSFFGSIVRGISKRKSRGSEYRKGANNSRVDQANKMERERDEETNNGAPVAAESQQPRVGFR